jgi:hypothetical protein
MSSGAPSTAGRLAIVDPSEPMSGVIAVAVPEERPAENGKEAHGGQAAGN